MGFYEWQTNDYHFQEGSQSHWWADEAGASFVNATILFIFRSVNPNIQIEKSTDASSVKNSLNQYRKKFENSESELHLEFNCAYNYDHMSWLIW